MVATITVHNPPNLCVQITMWLSQSPFTTLQACRLRVWSPPIFRFGEEEAGCFALFFFGLWLLYCLPWFVCSSFWFIGRLWHIIMAIPGHLLNHFSHIHTIWHAQGRSNYAGNKNRDQFATSRRTNAYCLIYLRKTNPDLWPNVHDILALAISYDIYIAYQLKW